jgi:lysozyme
MTLTLPTWDRKTVPGVALSLVSRLEGCRLAAYKDSTGVATIGVGSTYMLNGRRVQMGDRITQAQANELLTDQCEQWVRDIVADVSWPLNEMQASVLISFTHNLGGGAMQGSTLAKMLNAGRVDLAGDQLNGWAVAGGKPQLGLLRRREYERRLFHGEATEGQADYNAVWALGEAALMPLYQRAFAEAKAWGWNPQAAPIATPIVHPAPVPVASGAQSAADALDDQYNKGA